MSKQLISSVEKFHDVYTELFPESLEAMVLYCLYQEIKDSTSKEFDFSVIKSAIHEVENLEFIKRSRNIQNERLFKKLLNGFVERVTGQSHKFYLTTHAERVIEIVLQRIDNPYLKFPLKDTFESFFSLPENLDNDIDKLERWHRLNFINTSQQVVLSHLEALKMGVDYAVAELNKVLDTDALTAMQMLEHFSLNFQTLGDKARQVGEAIVMKDRVYYRLKSTVNVYMERSEGLTNESLRDSQYNYEQLDAEYKRARHIREDISSFFTRIDNQLTIINKRIAFASNKITELQESLSAKSHYKVSIKKILIYLLNNSNWGKPSALLPDNFPAKYTVRDQFRFYALRQWDLGFLKKGIPFRHTIDPAYELEQRNRFERELKQQQKIRDYTNVILEQVNKENRVDLSNQLMEIADQNASAEMAVLSGHEVIRQINSHTKINVERRLISDATNTFHLWKISLQNKHSSNS